MNASWYRLKPGSMLLGVALSMLAGVGPLAAEEAEAEAPQPVVEGEEAAKEGEESQAAGAQQALDAYAQERQLLLQGREAAGRFHYDQGMAALQSGDTPKALKELRLAVDYEPGNEDYVRGLRQAEVFAGVSSSPYETSIGDLQHRLDAHHQELWIDIERQIETGHKHIEQGSVQSG